MICQPDRAYVLASADRPQTKGVFGRSDPGPRCRPAGDDTAVNHKLPSWAVFPKTLVVSQPLGLEVVGCKITSTPLHARVPLRA